MLLYEPADIFAFMLIVAAIVVCRHYVPCWYGEPCYAISDAHYAAQGACYLPLFHAAAPIRYTRLRRLVCYWYMPIIFAIWYFTCWCLLFHTPGFRAADIDAAFTLMLMPHARAILRFMLLALFHATPFFHAAIIRWYWCLFDVYAACWFLLMLSAATFITPARAILLFLPLWCWCSILLLFRRYRSLRFAVAAIVAKMPPILFILMFFPLFCLARLFFFRPVSPLLFSSILFMLFDFFHYWLIDNSARHYSRCFRAPAMMPLTPLLIFMLAFIICFPAAAIFRCRHYVVLLLLRRQHVSLRFVMSAFALPYDILWVITLWLLRPLMFYAYACYYAIFLDMFVLLYDAADATIDYLCLFLMFFMFLLYTLLFISHAAWCLRYALLPRSDMLILFLSMLLMPVRHAIYILPPCWARFVVDAMKKSLSLRRLPCVAITRYLMICARVLRRQHADAYISICCFRAPCAMRYFCYARHARGLRGAPRRLCSLMPFARHMRARTHLWSICCYVLRTCFFTMFLPLPLYLICSAICYAAQRVIESERLFCLHAEQARLWRIFMPRHAHVAEMRWQRFYAPFDDAAWELPRIIICDFIVYKSLIAFWAMLPDYATTYYFSLFFPAFFFFAICHTVAICFAYADMLSLDIIRHAHGFAWCVVVAAFAIADTRHTCRFDAAWCYSLFLAAACLRAAIIIAFFDVCRLFDTRSFAYVVCYCWWYFFRLLFRFCAFATRYERHFV